jgi:hypothetical protein
MKTISKLAFAAMAYLGCLATQGVAQNFAAIQAESQSAANVSTSSLPADAKEIVSHYDTEKASIQKNARQEIGKLRLQLIEALQELQDRYTRDAKLDEAVAVRNRIRTLKESGIRAMPDPGVLYAYNNFIGRTFFFRVTGDNHRTVWGTDVYTSDSGLAAAAVHAGVLKLGQTGVVKVTIMPGRPSYAATTRNGVASATWQAFPVSFKVEQVGDDDEDAGDELPAIPPSPSFAPNDATMNIRGFYKGRPLPRNEGYEMPTTVYPATGYYVAPAVTEPAVELPQDAKELVDRFQAASAAIHKRSNRMIAALRHRAIDALKPLQDDYTRAAKLDEAVVIRDFIRKLQEPAENVLSDPGSLFNSVATIGAVHYIRVTGRRAGAIWGTDVYTADSTLAAVAVHAGALKEGQTGVVKVTILPGQPSYQGATRNGITSYAYGPFSFSYKVEQIEDENAADPIEAARDTRAYRSAVLQGNEPLNRQIEELRQEVSRLRHQLDEVSAKLKEQKKEEKIPTETP